jgi:lipopolysaccharide biosynthesis regulator YciM
MNLVHFNKNRKYEYLAFTSRAVSHLMQRGKILPSGEYRCSQSELIVYPKHWVCLSNCRAFGVIKPLNTVQYRPAMFSANNMFMPERF